MFVGFRYHWFGLFFSHIAPFVYPKGPYQKLLLEARFHVSFRTLTHYHNSFSGQLFFSIKFPNGLTSYVMFSRSEKSLLYSTPKCFYIDWKVDMYERSKTAWPSVQSDST